MKKLNHIFIISFVIAVITTFSACRKDKDRDDMRKSNGQQQVLLTEDGIEESPTPTPPANFLVRLEDNTLTLYERVEQEYNAIKSIDIDISYYPYEDIQELNSGIPAYSKESGFEILENFAN